MPDSVGTFVQEATLIILGGLLDRGRHPVEEGGERGAAAVQVAVGRVDPAVALSVDNSPPDVPGAIRPSAHGWMVATAVGCDETGMTGLWWMK